VGQQEKLCKAALQLGSVSISAAFCSFPNACRSRCQFSFLSRTEWQCSSNHNL